MMGTPFIRERMSRNRWEQIHQNLGFDLNFLKNELITRFKAHWTPYPFVSVDETLIRFKGRYIHRQHIRGKPHSTGLKLYGLADQYGFLYDFWFHEGTKKHTLSEVVLNFAEQVPNPDQHVMVVDSLFGSYELMEGLEKLKMHFMMACTSNHPTWLWQRVQRHLKRTEWAWRVRDKKIMALSFKDKKAFNILMCMDPLQSPIPNQPQLNQQQQEQSQR